MEEQKTMKVWVTPTKVITITLSEIPEEIYCECLTRLFNNKRENKAIKKITNFYGSNDIQVEIDLIEYNDGRKLDEKRIEEIREHLMSWSEAMGGYKIKVKDEGIHEAKIFTLSEWENKIPYLDENDNLIYNYVEWEY